MKIGKWKIGIYFFNPFLEKHWNNKWGFHLNGVEIFVSDLSGYVFILNMKISWSKMFK